jgi:hypothetical protein
MTTTYSEEDPLLIRDKNIEENPSDNDILWHMVKDLNLAPDILLNHSKDIADSETVKRTYKVSLHFEDIFECLLDKNSYR